MDVVLEVTDAEQSQDALQVGHRYVAIDQEPLDLLKHRYVGGVGCVGPIDAAERNDPHRRLRLLHHADLYRRRLAPQQPVGSFLSDCQVEVVERVASRVLHRMFKASKLCHSSSHLRPLGHGEPQPAHDVGDFLNRLRQRVKMAEPGTDARHSGIEAGRRRRNNLADGEPPLGRLLGRLNGLFRLVKRLAGNRLVGLVDLAEPLLNRL